MAKAKTPSDKQPIVDVARPGKTPPDDTSKAVIVTNRPMLKDPMVVETPAEEVPEKSSNPSNSPKEGSMKVRLVSEAPETAETTEPDKVDPAAELTSKSDTKTADSKPEKVEPKTQPTPADTTKVPSEKAVEATSTTPDSETDSDKTETEADNSSDEQGGAPAKDPIDKQAEQDKEAEHDAAIQKLVDSKQYYLPINTVEKRRTKRMLILGILLSLFLVAAWADIALDAGLIQINGVKPLTHFFSS